MSPVAKHTFAGWVTGSLHHTVTGMFFTSMICVQMKHEWWTSQGSLSCSPWQSVCHNWTATDATHSCMPVSDAAHENLFAATEQLQMPHTAVCQSLMQPMTVCLPQLNNFRCHIQLYARLWIYLKRYSRLVYLCVDFVYVVSEYENLV